MMGLCSKCGVSLSDDQGIMLISCLHVFCNKCAKESVSRSNAPNTYVKCGVASCTGKWLESEINATKLYLKENPVVLNAEVVSTASRNVESRINTSSWTQEVRDNPLLIVSDEIDCALCCDTQQPGTGIMLDACLHAFCRSCLHQTFEVQTNAEIKCPLYMFGNCSESISERELKAILSAGEFQNFLQRSLKEAQDSMINFYKCATENCRGWCNYEEGTRTFNCYACNKINCISCNAVHEDLTCKNYEEVLQEFYTTGQSINELMEGKRKSGWAQVNYLIAQNGHSIVGDDLILTIREIECAICMTDVEAGDAIILHDCFHIFCSECLRNLVNHSDEPHVKCPYIDGNFSCNSLLEPREIRALLSEEEYEKYMGKQLKYAEGATPNSFHCLTHDCPGFCEIVDDNVKDFTCEVCGQVSCVLCKVIHVDISCEDYRNRQVQDENTNLSEAALLQMLAAGTAMRCPQCNTIIEKNMGCDALVCSGCRSQLCWATKGLRWGPRGPGDTTGGCRCKVGGRLCVPHCMNCH